MNRIVIPAILAAVALIGVTVALQLSETPIAMNSQGLILMHKNPNAMIVDIRDVDSYMGGHIESSSVDNLQGANLEKRITTMQNRLPEISDSSKIIIVDYDGSQASSVAQTMRESGFEAYYLEGGINNWDGDLYSKDTPTTITSSELYQQIQSNDDIFLLDVRESDELEVSMISGSAHVPLADVFDPANLSEIPTDKPVVVICGSGNRATIATYELAQYGIDFQVLEGGIKAWDSYLEENQLDKI